MCSIVHGSLPQATQAQPALSGIHYARLRQAGLLCVAGHMLGPIKTGLYVSVQ